ncbi:putative 50S ribosomal subunit protein L6 [Candidatus Zinderia insecticola CARI]|uniref:50S ribosomal protein L6 n=1 Tax=Zinderia insecticola (strain CARI) TaxID=871271 RepID=E0TJ33_ZINIC|nr:putative 50S ribosomal subunit protein L6 [Candidatus Zinderia insecticola CARI]
MSRIGKKNIYYNKLIKIKINKNKIKIKGPLGKLNFFYSRFILIKKNKNYIIIKTKLNNKFSKSLYGTTRSIINNMVIGVLKGFKKKLIIYGIGYKININKNIAELYLGYSHIIYYNIPKNINLLINNNKITIKGIDKYKIGEVADKLRKYKLPEVYKGKGIRYFNENIILKEKKKK